MAEEEYKHLVVEHQQEMAELKANFDQEKDRQKRSIKDRVNMIAYFQNKKKV